jgi:hypothetical protein
VPSNLDEGQVLHDPEERGARGDKGPPGIAFGEAIEFAIDAGAQVAEEGEQGVFLPRDDGGGVMVSAFLGRHAPVPPSREPSTSGWGSAPTRMYHSVPHTAANASGGIIKKNEVSVI